MTLLEPRSRRFHLIRPWIFCGLCDCHGCEVDPSSGGTNRCRRVFGIGVSFGVDSTAQCVRQGLFFDPARLACGSCGDNQQVRSVAALHHIAIHSFHILDIVRSEHVPIGTLLCALLLPFIGIPLGLPAVCPHVHTGEHNAGSTTSKGVLLWRASVYLGHRGMNFVIFGFCLAERVYKH